MTSASRYALASDLDGTFTAGSPAARAALHDAVADHACDALIYITGRSAASARAIIMREQLPAPTMLVADIGTSVLQAGETHVAAIEQAIAARWPGHGVIEQRLSAVPGIEKQDVESPRRRSYWITANRALRAPAAGDEFEARGPGDPSLSAAAAAAAAATALAARNALGDLTVDVLVSGNVYLDVLPQGVNKGSTLLRVLDYLDIPVAHCVVAGDSLNDRALFEIGASGIVVGNCEPALRTALGDQNHVYVAREHGAAGILEGLQHFGLLTGRRTKGRANGQ